MRRRKIKQTAWDKQLKSLNIIHKCLKIMENAMFLRKDKVGSVMAASCNCSIVLSFSLTDLLIIFSDCLHFGLSIAIIISVELESFSDNGKPQTSYFRKAYHMECLLKHIESRLRLNMHSQKLNSKARQSKGGFGKPSMGNEMDNNNTSAIRCAEEDSISKAEKKTILEDTVQLVNGISQGEAQSVATSMVENDSLEGDTHASDVNMENQICPIFEAYF
ncbi:hypothetical protein VNO77_16533 [Canavalia gladiata]|uniref:Uncharacterized protein n=1 Tax=Canavalia gladiata TaxID=3824 RepID=A0AAN9QS56_CANGL